MLIKKLSIALILVVMALGAYSVVFASVYNGTVEITCTDFTALNLGEHILDRDNTGIGAEQLRIDITDGAGTLIFSFTYSNVLATYSAGIIGTTPYTTAPQYNPITFTLTSLAGNSLPEQVDYVQQGNCDGLPTFGDSCVPLTPFAVVGDLPFETQAYYEPGKEAPGVVLNAGTYTVLGVDESGGYYKIRLACEYLWVPVGSMQPSYQAPQNGQPLPTEVVS